MKFLSDHALAYPKFPFGQRANADNTAAADEGWHIYDVGGLLEIERNKKDPDFESDKDAIAHVKVCAQGGSELHARALAIHEKYGGD